MPTTATHTKKMIGAKPKEMRLKIDATTLSLKEKLFLDGDYARIAEQAATTAKRVIDCFNAGAAPQSLALAMKRYYAKKQKAQAAIDASGSE